MPRVNKEKTADLYSNQEISINKILSDASQGNISIYKENIRDVLKNKGHAKYQTMLKLLRGARSKPQKKETFVINTIAAMNSLEEQGVSKKTIKKLITLLFDKNLNYYKSSEKIKSFKQVSIVGDTWENKQDLEKNINLGVGGECGLLTSHLIKLIEDEKLCTQIENETGSHCFIALGKGYSREYFNSRGSIHVFVLLYIGNKEYILDPSFGEMSLAEESGYKVEWSDLIGEEYNYDNNYNYNHLGEITIDPITRKILNIYINRSAIPLGFLDGTDIFISVGYTKYKEVFNGNEESSIVPFIVTSRETGEGDVHLLDFKGKRRGTANNKYINSEKVAITKTLKLLSTVAGLDKISIESSE